MSSQTRDTRGDTNRLDLRTLLIASVSAAVAAVVVSRIWAAGTPIAAAATPVIVTILKELLDRPTARIAEKVTVQSRALPDTEIREPAASHVGRDVQRPEMSVYRQPPNGNGGNVFGRIKPKVVALTAALAFVIAGVVLTAGQLAIGNPFGNDGNGAIILGGGKKSKSNEDQDTTTEPQQTTPQEQEQQSTPPDQQQSAPVEPEQQQTTPQQTTPQQQRTTPQAPTQTTPGTVQP